MYLIPNPDMDLCSALDGLQRLVYNVRAAIDDGRY